MSWPWKGLVIACPCNRHGASPLPSVQSRIWVGSGPPKRLGFLMPFELRLGVHPHPIFVPKDADDVLDMRASAR